MKQKLYRFISLLSLIFLSSCGLKTHVINIVHTDGSITRIVTMKSQDKDFDQKDFRVPVDSTWETTTDFEINDDQDTIWIFTAEKHFANVAEINSDYNNDSGANKDLKRSAHFEKKFRWFTTLFRFSEKIERQLNVDCPVDRKSVV